MRQPVRNAPACARTRVQRRPLDARGEARRSAFFPLWVLLASCAEAAVDGGAIASPEAVAAELTPAACLSGSPIDLSVDLAAPPPSFYVNELRLGYSRGEAVFLSRPLCEEYGEPLCRFVEAHEQAHHYTKTVGHKSTCAETIADCWAAAHADREAVDAALLFFRSLRGSGGYHGEPGVRADVISHCVRRMEEQGEQRIASRPAELVVDSGGLASATGRVATGLERVDEPALGQGTGEGIGLAGAPELADGDHSSRGGRPSARPRLAKPFRVWGHARR